MLYSQGYPLDRGLAGPGRQFGSFGEKRNTLALLGIKTKFIFPAHGTVTVLTEHPESISPNFAINCGNFFQKPNGDTRF
jgi:hypothetical protein